MKKQFIIKIFVVEYKANRKNCEMYVSFYPHSYIGLYVNKA